MADDVTDDGPVRPASVGDTDPGGDGRPRPGGGADPDGGARPRVGVVMGSDSDLATMEEAIEALERFEVAHEVHVVSAHRDAARMLAYGQEAAGRGLEVLIAGAGGAAHLPGMLASVTSLPVIGVPVPLRHLDGLGLPAVDRPDALGHPRRHRRGGWRPQRGAAGGADPGRGRRRAHRRAGCPP
jgi:hypothetical protein